MVDECYARCDAHDLLVHKRTVDVTGNLGVFFVLSNMARFWKCVCAIISYQDCEFASKKGLVGAVCN